MAGKTGKKPSATRKNHDPLDASPSRVRSLYDDLMNDVAAELDQVHRGYEAIVGRLESHPSEALRLSQSLRTFVRRRREIHRMLDRLVGTGTFGDDADLDSIDLGPS